jgi:hypothetical protein
MDRVKVDLERLLVRAQSGTFVVFYRCPDRVPHEALIGSTGLEA